VADNLWELREQKKISVATLANRAGLPIGLIMEYESGQRSVDPRHLNRIARALYVEESDIKLRSDPRPGAAPLERQPPRDASRDMVRPSADRPPMPRPPAGEVRPRERPLRPRFEPRPPLPARPSQITHLEGLLKRLDLAVTDYEAQIGKPISSLDRVALSALLKDLQAKVKDAPTPVRRRAYLPESVDEFEARYLAAAQAAGDRLDFTLFDGSTLAGCIIGYGPYSITVRQADGSEVTLNKLALVSYTKSSGGAGQERPQ
jgi:transcriptional regulator with XRE-family HTH domain